MVIFKEVIYERPEILEAVLAPINSKVAPLFSKLTLHMVQFSPYNWVDLAPKISAKSSPISLGSSLPKASTKLDSLVLAPFCKPNQLFSFYNVVSLFLCFFFDTYCNLLLFGFQIEEGGKIKKELLNLQGFSKYGKQRSTGRYMQIMQIH